MAVEKILAKCRLRTIPPVTRSWTFGLRHKEEIILRIIKKTIYKYLKTRIFNEFNDLKKYLLEKLIVLMFCIECIFNKNNFNFLQFEKKKMKKFLKNFEWEYKEEMSVMNILQRSLLLSYVSATPKVTKKKYLKTRKKTFLFIKIRLGSTWTKKIINIDMTSSFWSSILESSSSEIFFVTDKNVLIILHFV
ncbi:hypothetical protein AGLY_001196 [Aphis glycines]|uniref:Uncharacterized protein n=1 Tax=Aphis glycines TaxID=307491 RepID=A0A6G0U9M2_APHGL|nr:hypothetical protein AGLY_001196 [Aphis glycines]